LLSIRPLTPADVDAVREVDARAFAPDGCSPSGRVPLPRRTRENILACLALNPSGCFVAKDGSLAGYIFSRRWGALGWIGVFGVDPSWQAQGVGKQLLSRAVAHLEAAGCATIGLETRSDIAYNAGFYTRAGFRLGYPSLVMAKKTEPPAHRPSCALLSALDSQQGLAAVTHISRAALPGLDYAVEAQNALDFGWGETLLVGWPAPWAAAIVRTQPKREGLAEAVADIAALAAVPGTRERIGEVLQAIQAFALERGLTQMALQANAADAEALQALLAQGFRIEQVRLRLFWKGDYPRPRGIEISRWAM